MIYVLGLLLVVYFVFRFGGLFRTWKAAGYPARPEAARNVRFAVGVILVAVLSAFFLWMAPEVTFGLVVWMLVAATVVLGMQFIRENLALLHVDEGFRKGSVAPPEEEDRSASPHT